MKINLCCELDLCALHNCNVSCSLDHLNPKQSSSNFSVLYILVYVCMFPLNPPSRYLIYWCPGNKQEYCRKFDLWNLMA